MSDIPSSQKLEIASRFLLESPPGEVNDVFNDIRVLVNDDDLLQEGIVPALGEHNTDQLVTARVPDQEYEVIITKHGQIEGDRFIDPRSKKSFRFDHLRQVASEVEEWTPEESTEPLRAAVEEAVDAYLSDHYPNGVSSVFARDGNITVAIVDNKYNPTNYWNGRWRSVWTLNAGDLRGSMHVNVHYYEDGNVQLTTTNSKEANLNLSSDPKTAAKTIVTEITRLESAFQGALIRCYSELAEDTFKSLRRTLPVTRNKLDWHKILNYRIGEEIGKQ
ncbi:uncharacterized protein VTP21DRAFT_11652 [Calcarisporiella thermophila]|uniref:uncharacterized protein n=1 Tax=Calcarisporiella thermophila TaxID=911321 RepID=UPI0037442C72